MQLEGRNNEENADSVVYFSIIIVVYFSITIYSMIEQCIFIKVFYMPMNLLINIDFHD